MPEKFEQQFRRTPEQKPEVKEKPMEKLQGFIKEMSAELRKEGVPVDEKGRINMDSFSDIYPKQVIENDKGIVQDLEEIWDRAKISGSRWSWILPREQILKQKTLGETWELLTTAILHKILGEDFIVVRSSKYDDARNNIDNIILDRKSGNIVCAFDEIGAVSGRAFEEKQGNVLRKNRFKGGADLKYGISFKEIGGKRKLKKGLVARIPLFYFASPEETVKKGLESFSRTGISNEEKTILSSFINCLCDENGQIESIKKMPLHPKFRERLEEFEAVLNKFRDVVK